MKENDLLARFSSGQKALELRAALMQGPSDGPFAGRDVLAGVRLCIRTAQNGILAETILPTAELGKARSIAEYNLGDTMLDGCDIVKSCSDLQTVLSFSAAMVQATVTAANATQRITGGMVTGQVESGNLPLLIGSAAKEVQNVCMDWLAGGDACPSRLRLPLYKDWTTNRESLAQSAEAGFVKVSGVRIDRAQYRADETGEEKMDAPWLIQVCTFDAPAVAGGYDQDRAKNKKKEQIALTDSQMFSLCERVLRIDEAFILLQLSKQ